MKFPVVLFVLIALVVSPAVYAQGGPASSVESIVDSFADWLVAIWSSIGAMIDPTGEALVAPTPDSPPVAETAPRLEL